MYHVEKTSRVVDHNGFEAGSFRRYIHSRRMAQVNLWPSSGQLRTKRIHCECEIDSVIPSVIEDMTKITRTSRDSGYTDAYCVAYAHPRKEIYRVEKTSGGCKCRMDRG